MSVSVLNTTSNLSGKTIVVAENPYTVTGLLTYDRDPNPPFAVSSGSAVVPNLDADKLDGFEGAAFLQLAGGTLTGLLTVDGRITFPAVQNPSSNANTLDDYEEGNWTPVLGGSGGTSGQTYSTQVGRYTKIGKLVFVQGYFVLTAKGTITGNCRIEGLPFTALNVSNAFSTLGVEWFNTTGTYVTIRAEVTPNSTLASIFAATAAAASLANVTTAGISDTTSMVVAGCYIADA